MDPFGIKDETGDFSKLKEAHHFNKKCNNELWETIDLLKQTTEQFQENQLNIQNQIQQSLDAIGANCITAEYANLKENFHTLQTHFNELNEKYEKAIAGHAVELEELQKRHKEELEVLKVEYSLRNCEFDDTIAKLKEELEVKEEEYLHDIHASQAESALRFDEMESGLQKLLDASNKKIRELNNSNSILRSEMMSLKSDFTTANSTKIQELESRLLTRENQLKIAAAKLLQRDPSSARQSNFNTLLSKRNVSTFVPKSNQITNQHPTGNYFNPLPISTSADISKSATVNLYKETKKTFFVRKNTYEAKENANVPPLKQVANATTSFTNCVQVKRRKLYSLNDVEHLENPD